MQRLQLRAAAAARRALLPGRRPSAAAAAAAPSGGGLPVWAEAARRKYEEEVRRRERRKQVAAAEREGDAAYAQRKEQELAEEEALSDALPVTEPDGWYVFEDHDAFPGGNVEQWSPAAEEPGGGFRKLEEAKFHCEKMGYGGFVQRWGCFYLFRAHTPRSLVLRREPCKKDDRGMHHLYVRPSMDGVPALDPRTARLLDEAKARGEEPQRKSFEPPPPTLDDDAVEGVEGDFAATLGELDEEDWKGRLPPSSREDPAAEGGPEEPPAAAAEEEELAGGLRRGDRVTAGQDIRVRGSLAVARGDGGVVVGPAVRSPKERVNVRWDSRHDGLDKGINVLPSELSAE